jgi:hypothetical protein
MKNLTDDDEFLFKLGVEKFHTLKYLLCVLCTINDTCLSHKTHLRFIIFEME